MAAPADGPEFLRGVPIFTGLPPEAVDELARRGQRRELVAGEWLLREGEVSDCLYLVRSGRLEVVRETGGAVLRSLGPGAALGELGVLAGSPRSASVRARRDSVVLRVAGDAFLDLLGERPELALAPTRRLASQLQASRPLAAPQDAVPPVIAVIALTEGPDPCAFAGELERELGRLHTVKLLDAEE